MIVALALLVAAPDFAGLSSFSLAPGEWRYRVDASASIASYGAAFEVRCDRATRRVRITSGEPRLPLTITTDTATRVIASDGWVAPRDPLLAAIAFSRGRFGVGRGGAAPVAIPVGPEAARSIEDCLY